MQSFLSALPAFSTWLVGLAIVLIVAGWPLRRHAQRNLLQIRGPALTSVTQTNQAHTAQSSVQTNELDVKGSNYAPVIQSNTLTAPQAEAQTAWIILSRIADLLQVAGFAILMLQIAKIVT